MTQLVVRVSGSGPDLALIHGWGLDGRIWDRLRDGLSAHFRLHIVDLPGYGDSPPQHGTAQSLDFLADTVLAALPPRVTLCGWSLGAHLAVTAATRHPAQVERLILVGATPAFVRLPNWPYGVAPHLLDDFESLLESNPQLLLSRFAKMINQGDQAARALAREAAALVTPPAPLPDVRTLAEGLRTLRDTDWRPLASAVTQPVQLVHGNADPLMPLAGAQAMQTLFASAALDIFADSAHLSFLSQPERFVATLARFAASQRP